MIKRLAFRAAATLLKPYHRQTRGLTLGTRTAVIDSEARVLLVRHTYAPGWLFPGGGVERGETVVAAALRELREEAGIVAEEEPLLHGLFLNDREFPGDHVACFVVRRFTQVAAARSLEIAEARFFATTGLPPETTPGTRRRLAEILDRAPRAERW
jgi:8-oxo-dGTP pyrophosphatase MutT (NUDIX family)